MLLMLRLICAVRFLLRRPLSKLRLDHVKARFSIGSLVVVGQGFFRCCGAACRNGTYESMLTLGHSWFGLRSWSETARQGSRRGARLVRKFSPLSHASKILNQSVLSGYTALRFVASILSLMYLT